ncbi:MAG: hypothetical protein WC476_08745 [Phycisphaerae bacterium]|jgi:hypothetical protein
MKRIILLIGVLVILGMLPVPPLPAEQDEPNITESEDAEPNIVEPNITEPNTLEQKSPIAEKTDLRILIKQLDKRIDYLENRTEFLLADNMANKADIEELQLKLNIARKRQRSDHREEPHNSPPYRYPTKNKHRKTTVTPKN